MGKSHDAIKVLVVDDSSLVRQTLTEIINAEEDMEVIATAQDPYVAAQRLKHFVPDVMTLDIEMPRMDGITFLKKIMSQHPMPVVICSSMVEEGSTTLMQALEAGATEVIKKPTVGTQQFLRDSSILITDIIRAASHTKAKKRPPIPRKAKKKLSADVMLSNKPANRAMAETTEKVIVIGSSTGGTEVVFNLLRKMPLDCPGIVVVQHMPEGFTASFAKRMNDDCEIVVKEARDGDNVLRGQALIAPGGRHTLLKRSGARYYVQIKDGPLVSRHRPSVDVLFRSAARYAGSNAVAAILTGMGDDGAEGMKELFDVGAHTIAQDERTSVIYGMPKEAVLRGGVCQVLALDKIAKALFKNAASKKEKIMR